MCGVPAPRDSDSLEVSHGPRPGADFVRQTNFRILLIVAEQRLRRACGY